MTTGRATLRYILARARIYFADEHIACDYCPCLETYSRKQCRLTGEYLLDTRTIGYNCPLEFEPEGGENHEQIPLPARGRDRVPRAAGQG